MKRRISVKHIGLILLLLIVLPAIFYSGYEISSLTASEEMLDVIYTRQLDAILFSLNQHAWDIVSNWMTTISARVSERSWEAEWYGSAPNPPTVIAKNELREFVEKNPAVYNAFLADSSGKNVEFARWPDIERRPDSLAAQLRRSLLQNQEMIERLRRYTAASYRKIEPIFLGDSSRSFTALVFVLARKEEKRLAGFILNDERFIRDIIGLQLLNVAGNEFILSAIATRTNAIVYTTEGVQLEELKQRKPLWLFPNYELGIRLKGTTVEEAVRARAYRNIAMIIVLDVVLLAGAWFVFRALRRELDFVRVKSDFISNVSHELRTPLALIRMFGETLEMGRVPTEERKKEYYSTIVNESERLSRLVNNILDFSKMEAGRKQYSFRATSLNDIVTQVVKTYGYHLQSEGFAPVIELDPELPEVNVDAEAVKEAVINLVDNAMKYSEAEKYLRVFTRRENALAVIGVEDRGAGIAEEHHKKIFETFYRVSSGLVHNTKGSGLGLSLVQHIMDAHRGHVTVNSAVGKGSTFELIFRLHSAKGE
ncbi:MAG: hypothetical protein HY961_20485 [Ignavibacteriae bacterium]|nr:hypothetical protein [Ignavibacteriota bacterium]